MIRKYRVLVEGRNFLIRVDDEATKCGFYATRFVEAKDPESAELLAMELIRKELGSVVLNDRSDTPMMYLEEIEEIEGFGNKSIPRKGFTWYLETD